MADKMTSNKQSKRVTISLFFSKGWKVECLVVSACILVMLSVFNNRNLNLHVYVRNESNHVQPDQESTSIMDTTNQFARVLEKDTTTRTNETRAAGGVAYPIVSRRNARVLAGIFSADISDDARYRYVFRDLLQTHPKVCSLVNFIADEEVQNGPCELIYTFVLGGNTNNDGPTQIVSNTSDHPILVSEKPKSQHSNDFHEDDITFLNIKENMNNGKSPTWFYYAGTVLDKYGLEYVMKIDTDSLLYLDRYFNFAESSLPPAPYNTRILAGAPVDKAWWEMEKDHARKSEPYFNEQYSTMHLYAAGQMYIMSHDLVDGVAHVAANDQDMIKYAEGHEDHDVSTMAFLALKHDEKDKPIKFIIIPYSDPFWKHPLKLKFGISNWKAEWDRETARMRSLTAELIGSGDSHNTNPTPHGMTNSKLVGEKSNRDTQTITDIPIIEKSERASWIKYLEKNNTEEWIGIHAKMLNAVQINNSIAPNNSCFLNTGYLQRPLETVQLTAPHKGGLHWESILKFITESISKQTDVIILNGMDVGMGRSNNVHTVQLIAEALQMNFAWAASEVRLATTSPVNEHGFSGPAILSKCSMYDPYLVREFHDQESMIKWKMIGSNSGLFVRMASADTIATGTCTGHHIVAGSASKLDLYKNRHMIWEYQFGYWPTDLKTGISPPNQLGSIIAGDIQIDTCGQFGLKLLASNRAHPSFPASCHNAKYGIVRTDNMCSNLMLSPPKLIGNRKSYTLYLPCYQFEQSNKESEIQLSQHSVVYAALH